MFTITIMSSYFTSEFIAFFKELEANNYKEWFDANKIRYDHVAKKPFAKLVDELIEELRKTEPEIAVEAKDCIFRINRDVRFSKDKTPYKTQVSAHISPMGRKDMLNPGLYLEITAHGVGIYGGIYMPDREHLTDIRWHIVHNLDAFQKAITHPEFVKTFGAIQGEKNKKLDAAFAEAAAKEPLLYNKQYYYHAQLPPSLITSPKLKLEIIKAHHAALPVREFLREALL